MVPVRRPSSSVVRQKVPPKPWTLKKQKCFFLKLREARLCFYKHCPRKHWLILKWFRHTNKNFGQQIPCFCQEWNFYVLIGFVEFWKNLEGSLQKMSRQDILLQFHVFEIYDRILNFLKHEYTLDRFLSLFISESICGKLLQCWSLNSKRAYPDQKWYPSVRRPSDKSTPQTLDAEKAKMNIFKTLWSTIMLLEIFSTDTLTHLKVI